MKFDVRNECDYDGGRADGLSHRAAVPNAGLSQIAALTGA